MSVERKYEFGGLVSETHISIEVAQRLLDKVNGVPCIQEVSPTSGKEYRRTVYFPRENGKLRLYTERNSNAWTDLSLFSKTPEHTIHLLLPLRVRNKKVSRTHRSQILEWYQLLKPGEEKSLDAIQKLLIDECLNTEPSLEAAYKEYPRVAGMAYLEEYNMKLFQVNLLP